MRNRVCALVCILFACLFVFVSCSEKGIGELVELRVSISCDGSRSMGFGSEAPSKDSIIWTYKLTKFDSGMTVGEGDEALLEGSIKVSPGRWQIEVWGYRDSECTEVVYVGKGEGSIGTGGGVLSVVATTTTDPLDANSLDPSKGAKNTAGLILGDLVSEKDVQLDLATYVYWRVDGKDVAKWEVRAGEDTMGNLQGHLYTMAGELITDETEIVVEVPAGIHDIQVFLMDNEGGVLSSLLWKDKEIEMNCFHRFSGTMPVKYLDHVDLFDVSPSWETVEDDQIIVGFAYDLGDHLQVAKENPLPVYVDELRDYYSHEELSIRSLVVESKASIEGISDIYMGKQSTLQSYDTNVKRVRFDPSATQIPYMQMNYCKNAEEIFIHEGIRDIQYYGLSTNKPIRLELPSTLDYMSDYAIYYRGFSELVFKNPEGWVVGGTAVSSETLSDPAAAATYYKQNYNKEWIRFTDERECVVRTQSGRKWKQVDESSVSSLEGYTCYKSQMDGYSYNYTTIKIIFLNDGDHTIYIRHNSKGDNCFISATELNASESTNSYKHKVETSSVGTDLESYESVTYEGVKAGDYCYVKYNKSSDYKTGSDGYVLVPDKVVSL